MPRKFRQLFRVQGMTARVYRRESGKGNQNYEIRLRAYGYNIYAELNFCVRNGNRWILCFIITGMAPLVGLEAIV